jgi:hypothetical protein
MRARSPEAATALEELRQADRAQAQERFDAAIVEVQQGESVPNMGRREYEKTKRRLLTALRPIK